MKEFILGVLTGLFTNWLWEFVFAAAIAAIVGYPRSKKEKLAGPVLYGLMTFVLVLVTGFVLTGHAPLEKANPAGG